MDRKLLAALDQGLFADTYINHKYQWETRKYQHPLHLLHLACLKLW